MSKKQLDTQYTNLSLSAEFLGNPLKFVSEYFWYNHKREALRSLHEHFIAIYNLKRRKKLLKRSGSDEYFTNQMLTKLLEAMWLIWMEDKERLKGSIPKEFHDTAYLFDKVFYTTEVDRFPWESIPCFLTRDKYFKPMRVVHQFFKKESLYQWKTLLNDIMYNLLSKGSADFGDGYSTNPYEIHFYLASLIEASYLIHVRQQDYFIHYLSKLQQDTIKPPSTPASSSEETVCTSPGPAVEGSNETPSANPDSNLTT